MSHIIVGTAGHVDHGKTELTLRLTGVNTDRLPEEKKRGMTIELGFVPLTLPSGQRLGLIDVPGHERFVKTMLAGVAGIDLVLLVVAADEGVMPQTLEHLHILHLLGVERGIVVLTKADLVDEEWLQLVSSEVRETLADTTLANAPMLAVSAHTGQGIDDLLALLAQVAAEIPVRPAGGHFRLPIDRVFSKVGFGTVITGTLWQGKLEVGQAVEIWPGGIEARVRGLQVHGQKVEQALAGQRTAVNLSGMEVAALPRGGWLAAPKLLRESWRLDVELRLLPDVKPIEQRSRLRIHHGTAEALARVQLLDREELQPGESCFCQLLLEKPLPPLRGDKIILRSYSPMLTIGGATVLDANPERHKRYKPEVLAKLERHLLADTGEILLGLLEQRRELLTAKALAKESQLPIDEVQPLLLEFAEQGRVEVFVIDSDAHYAHPQQLEAAYEDLRKALAAYHQQYPLRSGLALATAAKQHFPKLSQKQLVALLDKWRAEGLLNMERAWLTLPDWQPQPTQQQQTWLDGLTGAYNEARFNPPEWAEEMKRLSVPEQEQGELLIWLTEKGLLQKLADGVFFSTDAVAEARALLAQVGADNDAGGAFTLAEARDALGSSRKFTLALLEYFDQEKVTKRVGEKRVML